MPKMKTHKSTAKRFKLTGKGRLRRRKQGLSHRRLKKSKRVRRTFTQYHSVAKADQKRVRRLLSIGQAK